MIRRRRGSRRRFAFVVEIRHLHGRGDRLDMRFTESGAAGIAEIAEREQMHAVAGAAHLFVDLIAALQLNLIEVTEDSVPRPRLRLWLFRAVGIGRRGSE